MPGPPNTTADRIRWHAERHTTSSHLVTGLPAWLVAHLQAVGRHNPDGAARAARHRRCTRCTRPILAGLDGDRAAMTVECDPTEIDTTGELLALALNLRTYTLTRATNSSGKATWNIDPRDRWQIRAGQRTALVAEHRCGIAIPPAAHSRLPAWMTPRPASSAPPF